MDSAPSDHSIHSSRIEHVLSPATVDGGKQIVHDELDFFADHHKGCLKETDKILEDKEDMVQEKQLDTGLNLHTAYTTTSDKSSTEDGSTSHSIDDHKQREVEEQLEVVQAELGRMNVENQRLRVMIAQVNNNYKTLQVHLVELMQRQQNQPAQQHKMVINGPVPEEKQILNNIVSRQFMDMGSHHEKDELVGHTSSNLIRSNRDCANSPPMVVESILMEHSKGTVLHSGSKRSSGLAEDSRDAEIRSGISSGSRVPKKVPKFNSGDDVENQASEETMSMIKKARVSVRARSEASMISDGCQWRKYGQKMAKGNPCPRAYYRCTMGTGCPVRKQVQRCAEDKTILITTYEGQHNHALPPAAMTMASTTSSAASMLLSGSMPSADHHPHQALVNTSSESFLQRTTIAHSLLNCPQSLATLSASAPFPTVTLDLTRNPAASSETMPLNQLSNFPQNMMPLPQILGQALYNNESRTSLLDSPQGLDNTTKHSILADKVSAATAAITADPNFTAALVAAITSILGNNVHPNNNTRTGKNIATRTSSDDNS